MEYSAAPTEKPRSGGADPTGTTLWIDAGLQFSAWRDSSDPDKFDELVRLLTPVLWHVVRAAGTDEEQARDVLQTVWLALVRNPNSVRDGRAVGNWLVVSARRESWRVVGRDRRVVSIDPMLVPEPGVADSAETEALQSSESDALWRAVGRQSERCRRLARVAAALELTDYKTLAQDLGLAVGSLGTIRRRCLDALRSELEKNGVHRG